MNLRKMILPSIAIVFFAIGYAMSKIPAEQFVEVGSIIAVCMLALPAFYGVIKIYGKRGILMIAVLGVLALTIETIGVHTGFPYSHFEYTMPFGYRIFGTTPWTVAVAWSPLVIGAYLLAQSWFKQGWSRVLVYISLLVGADLVLDPGAVARGLWQYQSGGFWYQVPLQNFFGWIFSGIIVYQVFRIFSKKKETSRSSLIIGSSSLILSVSLWSGVTAGYQLWLPVIIGLTLTSVLIFGVLKKPSQ